MNDTGVIHCRTITRLWRFAQHLYSVGDVTLWVPLSHRTMRYTAAGFLPLWLVEHFLGVGWQALGLTAHFVLPGLLTWLCLRAANEGGRVLDSFVSWARLTWLTAHRPIDLRPVRLHGMRRWHGAV